MLKDFKAFLMRGNVVDLAVALVIGAAFGAVITSFVNDILMPPIGLALNGVDFTNLFVSLTGQSYASLAAAKAAGAPTLNYGLFFNTIINFVIVAFAMFLVIRQTARFFPPPPPPASTTRECPYCLSAVPLKATRCAHCTSELARPEMAPPAPGRA
ncbi:MAG TPA: large conductance mechanosensitive channel protein MscL [Methylomirabilota bacterium]|jgi:large conductance mechanosensitive channel|nr:large conductance mechanosensitive channel protein MscL [Methylomirabilota bacterium]